MKIGKIIGNVWATRKENKISGQKLLIVKFLLSSEEFEKTSVVAIDRIGAGVGDKVIVTMGSAAANIEEKNNGLLPVDALIVGIVDSLETQEEET